MFLVQKGVNRFRFKISRAAEQTALKVKFRIEAAAFPCASKVNGFGLANISGLRGRQVPAS